MITRALRLTALTIAIAAVVDPALTRERSERTTLAFIATDRAAQGERIEAIRRTLSRDFDVIAGAFSAADAAVVVGNGIPGAAAQFGGPVFAVRRSRSAAVATIERLNTPGPVRAGSRATVVADVRVRGAVGRTLGATLRADGIVVDTAAVRVTSADTVLSLALRVPLVSQRATVVRVEAGFTGAAAADSAVADGVIEIAARPWSVLVHDARASWASTFVRRSLERDGRFDLSSRIATSRGVMSLSGAGSRARGVNGAGGVGSASGLTSGARLDAHDLIIVGAPDALSTEEVSALERFLRQRGGAVILLLDSPDAGPWQRLAGGGNWSERDGGEPLVVAATAGDSTNLRAAEFVWPARLPAGAMPLAHTALSTRDSVRRPVVWSTPVGAGLLVVSGALDAWRFRDASQSAFDAFWREAAAAAALGALPAISASTNAQVVAPGALVTLDATHRAASLGATSTAGPAAVTRVRTTAEITGERVSLAPSTSVGTLSGSFRAPSQPGRYEVTVASGADSVSVPVVVAADARPPIGPRAALDALVSASGGRSFDDDELGALTAALKAAIRPAVHPEPWHPMRSPWWILPFALLLSAEWWLRRRSGQR